MNIGKRNEKAQKNHEGFILPIVIIVGLIIGAGLMALSARTFAGLMGSIRQGQSREAREIAESGMAIILKELNRNYPYLLIEDCAITSRIGTPSCNGWTEKALGGDGTFSYRTSICPRSDAPPQNIFPKLAAQTPGGSGQYRLLDYNFSGDQHQGGFARIKVMGQRLLSDGSVRATAYINREVVIRPKNCNAPVGEPTQASGFPGILGETVDLGNSDTLGAINGNVLCTTCDPNDADESLVEQVNLNYDESKDKGQGFVEGEIYGGQIAMPEVPDLPCTSEEITLSTEELKIEETLTISANSETNNDGRCCKRDTVATSIDSNGDPVETIISVSHCRVTSITLNGSGQALTIETEPNNQVRLYVEGDITISGSGQDAASIRHDGIAANLSIFGKSRSEASEPTQNVTLNGGPQALNMFLYMPEADVEINGGSSSPDVIGAVWAREYSAPSNVADFVVPDDMGSLIWQNLGAGFDLGIREYAALGTTDWSLVQAPSP